MTGEMRYIRPFAALGRDDLADAGGKGANLGELTRAGLPVPPGFVLTTAAYRAFVAGIGEEVLRLADLPRDAEPAAYDEPARRIHALFAAAPVPDDIAAELRAARAALGPAVAVRSSATAEDLEGASFAGQQDTFLDVRGDDALLAAVRDCWASLWTARAMAYRARREIDPRRSRWPSSCRRWSVANGADAAGVLFTANPTTGRRDEVVVAAAWGLGEAVVSGAVTTDDAVVEKATGRVRSRATADKAVMTVATGGGTAQRPVPAPQRTRPVLDDAELAALAALGVRIEEWFGTPQDVEWARAGGTFAIVQARPVTALPEPAAAPPTDWTVPDPTAVYVRASIVEQLPDPLTPLFAELVDGSVTRSLQALMGELLGPGRGARGRRRAADRQRLRLLPLQPLRHAARCCGRPRRRCALLARRRTGQRAGPLARAGTSALRAGGRGLGGPPVDGLSDAALLDGVVELLDAGHRVLHGSADDHPAGGVERDRVHRVLPAARAPPRRPAGRHVPAGVRQRPDPRRAVPVRPRRVDARAPRPHRRPARGVAGTDGRAAGR